MATRSIARIATTVIGATAAIGVTALALTFGATVPTGGVVAEDPPPTSAPPASPDGNGWGHG